MAVYTAIVQPDAEQTVAQDLGADQGTLGQIAAGFMVICVAPVAEEFFFRGFFYRALRSRYSILVAALIDGLLFGAIHWDFSSAEALLIVPPLAALGFMFCLVYERTGSLYPVIALHALNNAIAFAVTIEEPGISLVLGPLMLLACTLVPRAQDSGRPWHSERHMSIRHLLPIPLVMLALAPMAHAQTPAPPAPPAPPVTPPPAPAAGKATLSVKGGLATKKTRYFAPSQEVVVRGVVKPYVRGEVLTLYAIRAREGQQAGAPQGRAPRALRVPLQGRERRTGAARGEAQGERRAERLPDPRRDDPGGQLERGPGNARHEGHAAPARTAQARLRHAR